LDAATRQDAVAFEIDGLDEEGGSGWSVVVHGTAIEVDKDDETSALDSLGVEAWLQGSQPLRWIQIRPAEITGRRLPVRG
jgi:nitroimidazol reductase NimA-like FMN-containing flavoprotein (pyridoxamine 5'-phosphate oxidase superfamily)